VGVLLGTLGCVAALNVSASAATPGLQSDFFEPWYAQGTSMLNVGKTDLLGHLKPSFGLLYHLSDGLVQEHRVAADGTESTHDVLGTSHKLELSAALGLFDWVDVGLVAPLVLTQDLAPTVHVPTDSAGGFSLQDVRLTVRGRFLRPEDAAGFGVGAAVTAYLPTGSEGQLTGDGFFRLEPKLLADWRHDSGFAVALNLGVQLRPKRAVLNVVSSQSFRWSLGLQAPLGVEGLTALGTVAGTVPFEASRDPKDLSKTASDMRSQPMEGDLALQYVLAPQRLVFTLGGGTALGPGLGAPRWRVFAGVAYTPMEADRDGDGILDSDDRCPDEPEDRDGWADANGCPDPDNDKDGILDTADKCPNKPEDKDGFQDADGCPDPDNDKDGLADVKDRCPNKPEDKDGFQDADGCPDVDNDDDGLLDNQDKCPDEPEDIDEFEDEDGCPDPDNDKDGIPDTADTCPNKPETVNQFEDEDGCPDNPKARVQISKRRIKIKDKVYFKTNKAKIKKRSFKLLNEVAKILLDNPQITKLRIEGHTDSRGPDRYNMKLSQRRAESVRQYLIAKGVDPGRLEAKGYGETRPVASNKTSKGRAANRRTDFFILEVNGHRVDAGAEVEVPVETPAGGPTSGK